MLISQALEAIHLPKQPHSHTTSALVCNKTGLVFSVTTSKLGPLDSNLLLNQDSPLALFNNSIAIAKQIADWLEGDREARLQPTKIDKEILAACLITIMGEKFEIFSIPNNQPAPITNRLLSLLPITSLLDTLKLASKMTSKNTSESLGFSLDYNTFKDASISSFVANYNNWLFAFSSIFSSSIYSTRSFKDIGRINQAISQNDSSRMRKEKPKSNSVIIDEYNKNLTRTSQFIANSLPAIRPSLLNLGHTKLSVFLVALTNRAALKSMSVQTGTKLIDRLKEIQFILASDSNGSEAALLAVYDGLIERLEAVNNQLVKPDDDDLALSHTSTEYNQHLTNSSNKMSLKEKIALKLANSQAMKEEAQS